MKAYYAHRYAELVTNQAIDIEDVPLAYRQDTQKLLSSNGFINQLEITDSIEQAMEEKWKVIKAIRDEKEVGGCPYKGSVLDSDMRSVLKINTAISAASKYGNQFVINWTMQDNTVKTLTYYDLMEIPLILANFSNRLHEKARGYRNILKDIVNRYNNGQITKTVALNEIKAVKWED